MQFRRKIFTQTAILLAVSGLLFHSHSGSAQNQQAPVSSRKDLATGTNSSRQESFSKNNGNSNTIPPQIVKRFDVNQDGILDSTEMAAAKAARKERMLEKFDKNGDGNLSEEEKAQARQFMQEQQNFNKNANKSGQMRSNRQNPQAQ